MQQSAKAPKLSCTEAPTSDTDHCLVEVLTLVGHSGYNVTPMATTQGEPSVDKPVRKMVEMTKPAGPKSG